MSSNDNILVRFESTSKDGVFYDIKWDRYKSRIICSCPGMENHGHCKHQAMILNGKYPTNKMITFTLLGKLKWSKAFNFYNK